MVEVWKSRWRASARRSEEMVFARIFVVVAILACIAFGSIGCTRQDTAVPPEDAPQFPNLETALPDPEPLWGEVHRGLHPALIEPSYAGADRAAAFVADDDIVYVFRSGTATYVYPQQFLCLHHVINDVIDGQPVLVSLCMLCDSASAYSRRLDDRVLTFDSLGSLYYGNLVVYDRETDSHWIQLTGVASGGPLRGRRLTKVRSLDKTKWSRVKQRGNLKVLAPVAPLNVYREFYESMRKSSLGGEVLQQTKAFDPRLPPYTPGLGVQVHGAACFFPSTILEQKGLIQQDLGGWSLLLVQDTALETTRIFRRRVGQRLFNFEREGAGLIDRETGTRWSVEGVALKGPLAGAVLEQPAYTSAYWFSWAAFHPGTDIFQAPN